MSKNSRLLITIILAIGLFFRLYHIEFGLPHSLHADEPEFGEFAIKYTYEIRSIVANNDWYKLIPLNFVYGTFPIYAYTLATMTFSKTLGILGIAFEKMHIYIFLRSLTALASLTIAITAAALYKKLFKDNFGAITTAALVALNWQFIVMAHYLNADIILAILLSLAYLTTYLYYQKQNDSLFTFLTGILLGLAAGTKITSMLTLPLFLYIFIKKRDWRGMFGLLFIILSVFAVTNPFSLIFANDFAFRILTLFTKEGGVVFDSIDTNPFKYVLALGYIATPIILAISLYGKWTASEDKSAHLFLIGQVLMYVIFYSLGTRRVDRWLLPILPIVLMYAAHGISTMTSKLPKIALTLIVLLPYLYFPILLLFQFQRQIPKTAAYLWMRDNTLPAENKLVITELGLDPMNKLPSANVRKSVVYTNENAQFVFPESPIGYKYIVISSKPMTNFKRPKVVELYPEYAKRWQEFENQLRDTARYKLIKAFVLPKPNLIPLSDVYIYENLHPIL